jgi:RHS repeat-associated protein
MSGQLNRQTQLKRFRRARSQRAFKRPRTRTKFTYDGLGRLVRVVDTHGGAITADHSYTWCGNVRCLAHDNTQSGSPVSTQYFDQGAIISGTSYYYVKDQLGSVTQLITTAGTVAAQYTFDPYGNQTTISGTVVSDIGYAGYFYHAVSGLDFTLYRAYDTTHARWLNRDPIGEAGGINLYAYTSGSPISRIDPLGLDDSVCLLNPSMCGSSSALPIFPASAFPSLPQGVVDAGVGSGEGIVRALTFNRVSLQETLELLELPHGGANTCSTAYQVGYAFGAFDAAVASLGSGVARAVQLSGVRSTARATLIGIQLLVGTTDAVESLESSTSLVQQLTSLEEIVQEAVMERGLIVPRPLPLVLRLPPPL